MLPNDYIVGLSDGEGSFTCFIRKPEKPNWNHRIECHFYIKLREDDLEVLRKVKRFFGCGRISFQKDNRKNHRDNYRYEVSNLDDLGKTIIPFFRKYPLQSKRKKDFEIFCKIIEKVYKKKHHEKNGIKQIKKLKLLMHK